MMSDCRKRVCGSQNYQRIRERLVEVFHGRLQLGISREELRNTEQAEEGVAARLGIQHPQHDD